MKTIIFITFAVTLFAFSACTKDEKDDPNDLVGNTVPMAVQFTAGIVTRAFNQQWEVNDSIGVTGTSGDIEYQNVNYRTIAGDGAFTVGKAGTEIYFQVPEPTTFTAYYPFTGVIGTLPALIGTSTDNQQRQNTFDFLYGTGTGSKATPLVAFLFSHSMSKCILNIKPGADITFANITGGSSTLTGVNHNGDFNPSTGIATATGVDVPSWAMSAKATPNDVTIPVGSEIRTYSLILFPQTIGMLTYSTVIDGQSYTSIIGTTLTMEANKSYSYNITVNKTGLTISKATIAQWTLGNGAGGTDVDAEM